MDDIIVCGNIVTRVGAIKLLHMDLDSQLSFKSHIVRKSRTAIFSLLEIKHIRKHLTGQSRPVKLSFMVWSCHIFTTVIVCSLGYQTVISINCKGSKMQQ